MSPRPWLRGLQGDVSPLRHRVDGAGGLMSVKEAA